MPDIAEQISVSRLNARLEVLEAEAEIRRLQSRYMFLCDTPCPEYTVVDDAERIDKIVELYAEDAVWEGVGEYYGNQFGRAVGHAQIRAHFKRFWAKQEPALVLNAHYLASEHINVHEDRTTADGQWIHIQPWLYSNGTGLLRSSRLNNLFRRIDGRWRVARTRTESVFIAPLPNDFASNYPSASVLMRPDGGR